MATKGWIVIGLGALLASGSCEPVQESGGSYCQDTHKECHLSYSAWSGYQRYCSSVVSPCAPGESVATGRPATAAADAGTPASPEPATRTAEPGAAPLPEGQRYSAFDLACERDSQCGPGKCIEGACYYGCQSDSQCGTGDRCAAEQGTRICMPDPNPPVQCTRSAQCSEAQLCLNGSCVQTCATTEECSNLVDRCASGICQPDRRPLGECVLSSECAAGFACLDGACVEACAAAGDAGVCLPSTGSAAPAGRPHPEQTSPMLPLASVDAGSPDQAPSDGEAEGTPDDAVTRDAGAPPEPEAPAAGEPDAGSIDSPLQ